MANNWRDDRSLEERTTHPVLVGGTDKFLGSWGRDIGVVPHRGRSLAFWACRLADLKSCMEWVTNRGDITYIRETTEGAIKRYKAKDDVHIYVWTGTGNFGEALAVENKEAII